jgi:hypothetical protein
VPVAPDVKPGELVCSNCGTGNDPTRRFCRRCGTSLVSAVVARKPPWYRRLFGRERAVAAGERPGRMGRSGRPLGSSLIRVVAIVLAIAVVAGPILGYMALPEIRTRVDSFIEELRFTFLTSIEDVHPIAHGEGVDERTADLAVDNNTATFWLSEVGESRLTVHFEEATDLAALVFHVGGSPEADFTEYQRPRTIEVQFPDTSIPPAQFQLKDQYAGQSYFIDARGVENMDVLVVATFGPRTGGGQEIALREIEFKARR